MLAWSHEEILGLALGYLADEVAVDAHPCSPMNAGLLSSSWTGRPALSKCPRVVAVGVVADSGGRAVAVGQAVHPAGTVDPHAVTPRTRPAILCPYFTVSPIP